MADPISDPYPRSNPSNHHLIIFGIAAGVAALFGVNIWLAFAFTLTDLHWLLIFMVEALVAITIIGFLWVWLEGRVFRPLRRLAEEITIIARSNPAHRPDASEAQSLGLLPGAVDELGGSLLRARSEIKSAMEAAAERLQYRNARLEAILRDLSEGLIVCNVDHRIVLFNQSASEMLHKAGQLGVRRGLEGFLKGKTLHAALAELQRERATESQGREVLQFTCKTTNKKKRKLQARMSLIIEEDEQCVGYVLTLIDPHESRIEHEQKIHVRNPVPTRPEFYDFEIFQQTLDGDLMDQRLNELEFVVFDTETTGLKPSEGDEIVQIAGVRVVNNRILRSETFDRLVNPGRSIPPASTRFHGITEAMVKDHPPADVVLPQFEVFTREAVLVAHNAAFDVRFLKLKETALGLNFDNPVLDTLLLSVVLYPNIQDHTLDGLANRFDVPIGERHTALGDSLTTAEVFVRMISALEHQGIHTLREAIDTSNQVFEIRRQQQQF